MKSRDPGLRLWKNKNGYKNSCSKTSGKHSTIWKLSLEPHGQFSLEELLGRWDDTRKKTRTHIDEINSEKAADLVYRHPFAGPLNIAETLRFIDVHFDNHMRHIDRIIAAGR